MMGLIDYGLLLLFFIGILGLIWLTAQPRSREEDSQTLPAPRQAKSAYALVAALFVLLIVLTFFARRSPDRSM